MADAPLPGADQLYEAAPCALLLATADGTLLHVNATLCQWLRYRPQELVGKLRLQDLLAVGGRIFWQTHLQPLLRMQGSVAEVKLELRTQDGRALPMMVNAAERAWNGQTLLHVAAFIAEDRHKYERELLLQRQRAEDLAALHARDQQEISAARAQAEDRAEFAEHLVGMVSHDIRNPLSVVQMSAALLERGVGPEQQKAAVARIARSVQRMQHLIADLLDFSQVRLGSGLSVRKTGVDLHQAIADSVAEWQVAFPHCPLRHERSGPGMFHADPDRIVQAIGNLVANAAAHGARDAPLTVRSTGDASGFRIAVHNEGDPIPAELQPRLFEPMVRGKDAVSKGVGLGLYIVREVARAHGGAVDVDSRAGSGTTFTLHLPAA